jgi:murein DD-endopeptidase
VAAEGYDGVINGSFYVSARNAGIPANHIQKIANLFQWRLNFAKDLKKGDKFKVLVRQETVEGKSTGNTQLLGVEVFSQGRPCQPGCRKMATIMTVNSLARLPPLSDYSRYRVSSSFNPNAVIPITGQVRPHGDRLCPAGRHAHHGDR